MFQGHTVTTFFRIKPEEGEMDAQTAEKSNLLAGYLTVNQFCQKLGITERTARKWRQTGESPPWATIGSAIYYPEDEFRKWLKKRVRMAPGR
jgi:excisionase family DNA binding protein